MIDKYAVEKAEAKYGITTGFDIANGNASNGVLSADHTLSYFKNHLLLCVCGNVFRNKTYEAGKRNPPKTNK